MGGNASTGVVDPGLTELETLARVLDSLARLRSLDSSPAEVRGTTDKAILTVVRAADALVAARSHHKVVFNPGTPVAAD